MKFGIYDGSIVEVAAQEGNLVDIIDNCTRHVVSKDKVYIICDDVYKEIAQELLEIKSEIKSLLSRMYKLDDEYHKKMELLRQLYMDARAKEMSVVNKVLKNSHGNCQK